MTPELLALTLGLLLQGLQFALFAIPANLELGTTYTASPRDTAPPRPLSLRTGRLQRALGNMFEALILFAPAALIVALTGQSTGYTATLAWAWLVARAAYVPAYTLGWTPWRSAIWAVGFLATLLMALAALV
jgi:uncharacterized MAPEG superfamily protein